ncbi:MAG: HEXXH motif-containing putative peptide modification protein [Anderseniella sp.]
MTLEEKFFNPSAASGSALRAHFNNGFADSLEYLLSVCEPSMTFDGDRAEGLLSRIRSGSRESPCLYSRHFKLIEALQAEDMASAETLIKGILAETPAEDGIVVISLGAQSCDRDTELVTSYFCEADSLFSYVQPDPERAAQTEANLYGAMEDLRGFAPGLAAEMDALVNTVILATGIQVAGDEPGEFESVTALRAFGAVLFNADSTATRLQCVVSLIHEHAHMVLFAHSPNEGVVTNSPDERYVSPLRSDARPVEGIFHQSFVLARMIYGMDLLRKSDTVSQHQHDFANEFIGHNVPRFTDAVETLHRHARFTPQGLDVIRSSEAYIDALA